MSLTRRDFLRLGGVAAVTASATACGAMGRRLAQDELPETLPVPTVAAANQVQDLASSFATDPALRLLNRAGFGPRHGELERVSQMGLEAYLEEQLNPDDIDDSTADLMIRNLNLYQMDASQLMAQEPREAAGELMAATFIRALYSKRQLYEAMVGFWSDHFNIYLGKTQLMPLLKLVDDRDVIRPNALGKFSDLLAASARSPAMLVYLDNVRNQKGKTNENYARELMELHTLGVDGGYTQQDVAELARALTGWSVARRGRRQGQFSFNAGLHDTGEKQLLGHLLPAGQGEGDIEQALQILLAHPATASHISRKLVRRFVADMPPESLVSRTALTFRETGGEIASMLRVIFLSDEFAQAPPKLKRPFSYMVSALRGTHADLSPRRELARWLQRLGQPLFGWPPPNGYPDVSEAWTANLLARWNFSLVLLHQGLPGVNVPLARIVERSGANSPEEVIGLFNTILLGRPVNGDLQSLLVDYVGDHDLEDRVTQQRLRDAVALMLASPYFQWT